MMRYSSYVIAIDRSPGIVSTAAVVVVRPLAVYRGCVILYIAALAVCYVLCAEVLLCFFTRLRTCSLTSTWGALSCHFILFYFIVFTCFRSHTEILCVLVNTWYLFRSCFLSERHIYQK